MFKLSRLLVPALAGLTIAANPAWAQSVSVTPNAAAASANPSKPVTVLAPASQPDPLLNNGCWVQLSDNIGTPAKQEYLTIIGSKYMPTLETVTGQNWNGRADGMSVGPNALVAAYGEEGYGGPAVLFRPNQIVQDLRANLGLIDSIESMKIECRNT
ncbi:hypothetical protein [Noviherbaspirillum sp.]|uniref:hypothetical protein n=1 Tax=Noviherbaspirillum sp. TaxID=1926288 RepID=UPI002FE16709